MSKKNSLPDSLELLLDTMCNTFGGIMFIAISLIIISSMVSKNVLSLLPEEIDAAAIKKFEAESEEIRRRIDELQKEEAELVQTQLKNLSPERQKIVQDIALLRQKNRDLKKTLEDQDLERRILEERNAAEEQSLKDKRKKTQAEEAQVKAKLRRAMNELAEQKRRTEKIQKEFDTYVPREMTFSMEEATSKEPYFIGVTDGKLFHMGTNRSFGTDEVTVDRNEALNMMTVKLRPGKGISVGRGDDRILGDFFRKISSDHYFIFFSVGRNSFSEFYKTKQYLRRKGFQVYWIYNPDFQFSRGTGTSYRASE